MLDTATTITVTLDACTPEAIHELAQPSLVIAFTGEAVSTFAGAAVTVTGTLQDVLRLVLDNWVQDGDLADLAANMGLPEIIVGAACLHYGLKVVDD